MPTNSLGLEDYITIRQSLIDDIVKRGRYTNKQRDYLEKLGERSWQEDNDIECAAVYEEIQWQKMRMDRLEAIVDKINELIGEAPI